MALLEIKNVSASYGDLKALFDVNLKIDEGEVVSLVGSNGAGKTTLLRIISGLMPVKTGTITFEGKDLLALPSYARADLGIAHIPQGRGILDTISIQDNLILGAYSKRVRAHLNQNMEKMYDLFPILAERRNQMAGSLSGGQQQMLAIARSMMMEPKLLMLDEPSLGLAPIIVNEVFDIIRRVSKEGMAILIVEQNLVQALGCASYGYVLETGSIALEGAAQDLLQNEDVRKAYLGV